MSRVVQKSEIEQHEAKEPKTRHSVRVVQIACTRGGAMPVCVDEGCGMKGRFVASVSILEIIPWKLFRPS